MGNRCKKCASRFSSHVTKIPAIVIVRTALAATAVGFGFGSIYSQIYGGYYGWILLYVAGFLIGQGLHKLASYKLGGTILTTIILSMILGSVLSTCRNEMIGMIPDSRLEAPKFENETVKLAVEASEMKAKQNFDQFVKAFNDKKGRNFQARIVFREGDYEPRIWFKVDSITGTKISGQLSAPDSKGPRDFGLTTIKDGDPVKTDLKDLQDWRYESESGEEVGAFTDKYLRKFTPEAEGPTFSAHRLFKFWINLALLIFGVISPVLRVRLRN